MADHVTRDELLTATRPELDVTINAGTVRVRALTEAETEDLKALQVSVVEREAVVVALAFVAPKLSLAEAATWMTVATPADVETVMAAVFALSGIGGGPWRR